MLAADGHVVNTEGTLPDGQITEYHASTIASKFISSTRLNGKTVMTDCATGAILSEENFQNGLLHGCRTLFYPDAKPRCVENYKHGKLDGSVKTYYPSGTLRFEDMYSNGEFISRSETPDGPAQPVKPADSSAGTPAPQPAPEAAEEQPAAPPVETSEPADQAAVTKSEPASAQPELVRKTENNARIYYLGDKEIAREILSPAGDIIDRGGEIPDCIVNEFYPSGKPKVSESYRNGTLNGPRIKYDELGRVWAEETYLDGTLNGLVKIHNYFKDKVFEEEASFKNNKLDGMRKSYYPNGHISVAETYKDGLLDGIRKSYYENSRLNTEEMYEHDRLNGPRKRYYDNGQLWNEELYENGQLNGRRTDYYISGQVRLVENYKAGKLEGDRIFYYENGKPMYEETYTSGKLMNRKEFRKRAI
ncbi:MAG: hypothetical protein PHW69_07285 [Elusimicrobiaceae bacterium]|nr:hypothetical protein [Elusimicrobiaceae bacterium]